MNLFNGIQYNLRGMWLGIRTPKLLLLGLVRFFVVVILTVLSASILMYYHTEILSLVWKRPDNQWLLWAWYFVSWLTSVFLAGVSTVIAYLVSQILFSVLIMDTMSQITERMTSAQTRAPVHVSVIGHFFYLMRQEIPRAMLPVLASLILMLLGWMTPFGPVFAILSTLAAVTFLAWDNTDLVPARAHEPFGRRFRFLLRNLPFHVGFGLPFIIPLFNILSLSFAPVGGTLYYTENYGSR